MPVPFPATESGVEIRLLELMFTPDEARLALHLSAIPESLPAIHRRIKHKLSLEDLRAQLNHMAEKGLIHRLPGKSGPKFCKAPLVVGMYEAFVNRLTPELERKVRAYFDEKLGAELARLSPQLRTVPVNKSIPIERPVGQYDDLRRYVDTSPGPFAAQPCICRQGKDLTGEACRQTSERRNCLLIGFAATSLIQKGIASEISKERMLGLLEDADRDGLVLQPQNTREPLFVCCCCGCCCGVLTTARKLPRPADAFASDFIAEIDATVCEVCGECGERCQMDAIASDHQPPKILEERCIGCGLCVSTCPSGAMRLRTMPERKPPPKDTRTLYMTMFQERFGRIGTAAALAGHVLGRKF
jgi:Na+-translocating ferredoxin:NAD+ oxidoreductase subunit B